MTNLMEPLEDPQLQLLNIVWPLFIERQRFPVFNYVDYKMRQSGLDAGEVIDSLPSIQYGGVRGRCSAIWTQWAGSGSARQSDSPVCLTMAGLYHIDDHAKMPIIHALLSYLRSLSAAQVQIADHPFDVPRINLGLKQALTADGVDLAIIPWAAEVAQHEWLAMRVNRQIDLNDATGELSVLTAANFFTIEEYLNAITAVTTPQQPTSVLERHDPRALA